MTSIGILQILVFFGLILLLTKPVGLFMSRLFQGERTFLHPVLRPIERARLQAVRRPGGPGTALDAVRRVAAGVQPVRVPVPVRAHAAPGPAAAQSPGIRREPGEPRPVVQHRHELHDEHELAVVQRRIDDELSRADGRAGRAELRVGRGRHRGGHCVDSRLRPSRDRQDRELLGRPDPRHAVRADSRSPSSRRSCCARRAPSRTSTPTRSPRRSKARRRRSRRARSRRRRPSSSSARTAAASSTPTRRTRSRARRRSRTSCRSS